MDGDSFIGSLIAVVVFVGIVHFLLKYLFKKESKKTDDSVGIIAIDVEGEWKKYDPVLYCSIKNAGIHGFDTYIYWLVFENLPIPIDVDPKILLADSFEIFTGPVSCHCCDSKINGAKYSFSKTNRVKFDINVKYPVYTGSIVIKGKGGNIRNKSFRTLATHITIYDALNPFRKGESINWVPIPLNLNQSI